jgi:hypothetical protein
MHRYFHHGKGVVLRFSDRDLFVATIDGRWVIANGPKPPAHLTNELGPDRQDEIRVNHWLAG